VQERQEREPRQQPAPALRPELELEQEAPPGQPWQPAVEARVLPQPSSQAEAEQEQQQPWAQPEQPQGPVAQQQQ